MTGFDVYTDEMRAHAGKLHKVGDRLHESLGAAGQTTLNIQAFGLIGQFLVPAVLAVEGVVTGAIGAAELGTHGVADGIKAAADLYDDTEGHETKKWMDGH